MFACTTPTAPGFTTAKKKNKTKTKQKQNSCTDVMGFPSTLFIQHAGGTRLLLIAF